LTLKIGNSAHYNLRASDSKMKSHNLSFYFKGETIIQKVERSD